MNLQVDQSRKQLRIQDFNFKSNNTIADSVSQPTIDLKIDDDDQNFGAMAAQKAVQVLEYDDQI